MPATKTAQPVRRKKAAQIPEDMTIGEFIRHNCRDRRSTLRFFKLAGLTWDKKGNPIIVPR